MGKAPNLSQQLAQLGEARERMNRVNAMLSKIQKRLEKLYQEHDVGTPTKK